MTLLQAADLQDHLMTATNDLERLQRLLADTCDMLMARFYGAFDALGGADAGADHTVDATELLRVRLQLGQAVTALQFQDMASQLIAHTHQRLRGCADQLARDAFGAESDDDMVVTPLPSRPNPVTQDEMDAGSVDLF
ncbi:MAG TPA: hypothetical protein VFR90_05695 [Methylibium sp.]|uniref:hypothetical protein n=1 Tax=Methylibium sp. TaxID=2067992 RepID=UPI002DB68654|nr:hypothetical protein [Methylibium sp.]HEU4458596.1 hypothetical protein [Methylibium sp.]